LGQAPAHLHEAIRSIHPLQQTGAGITVFRDITFLAAGPASERCRSDVVLESRARYGKFRWDENRGDQHAAWGASWWYFETGSDGYVTRQVEVYDLGIRLRYGPRHQEDEFGGLSQGHESELDRSADQEMTAEEFVAEWARGSWHNEGQSEPGATADGGRDLVT
jgi:hypothetical protein